MPIALPLAVPIETAPLNRNISYIYATATQS